MHFGDQTTVKYVDSCKLYHAIHQNLLNFRFLPHHQMRTKERGRKKATTFVSFCDFGNSIKSLWAFNHIQISLSLSLYLTQFRLKKIHFLTLSSISSSHCPCQIMCICTMLCLSSCDLSQCFFLCIKKYMPIMCACACCWYCCRRRCCRHRCQHCVHTFAFTSFLILSMSHVCLLFFFCQCLLSFTVELNPNLLQFLTKWTGNFMYCVQHNV